MVRKTLITIGLALALVACGDDDGGSMGAPDAGGTMGGTDAGTGTGDTDAGGGGTGGTDAGGGGTGGTDAGGGGTDAGTGGGGDACLVTWEDAEAAGSGNGTVGCNGGFLTGAAPANADFGSCTSASEDDEDWRGTCTSPEAYCDSFDYESPGVCLLFCEPGPGYVSTGSCPTGSRCFDVFGDGSVGLCFRDCDAAHPCPAGQECDPDGSCVLPD